MLCDVIYHRERDSQLSRDLTWEVFRRIPALKKSRGNGWWRTGKCLDRPGRKGQEMVYSLWWRSVMSHSWWLSMCNNPMSYQTGQPNPIEMHQNYMFHLYAYVYAVPNILDIWSRKYRLWKKAISHSFHPLFTRSAWFIRIDEVLFNSCPNDQQDETI